MFLVFVHFTLLFGNVESGLESDDWVFFCLQYEKHEEKVDPAHAHRHHLEMQAAEAAALGFGGYAVYEHHEANKFHKQEESMYGDSYGGGSKHDHHGKHKHHFF